MVGAGRQARSNLRKELMTPPRREDGEEGRHRDDEQRDQVAVDRAARTDARGTGPRRPLEITSIVGGCPFPRTLSACILLYSPALTMNICL